MTDILDRLENFLLYSYPPGEGVYKMMALHRAVKAALEAKAAEQFEVATGLGCEPNHEIVMATIAENAETRRIGAREIAKLREALEDAGHYVALCPPPTEATGALRIELLERRERVAKAAALEQTATREGMNR